jgi:type I restriction enzyme S subunit
MEVRKGYKQTEVGVIPEDWDVKRLGDFAELTSSKRIFESDYVPTGVPFFRGKEVSLLIENKPLEDEYFISDSKYEEIKRQYGMPQKGDILITAVGTLGNIYVVPNGNKFYFKDGNLIWCKSIKGINLEYLAIQIRNQRVFIINNAIGSSQKALTIIVLKETPIPLPPTKAEQTAIAAALSEADALIQSLEKLITKKRNIKQGTMQELLKPKEGWVVKAVPDVCWFQEGPGVRNSQFKHAGVKLLNGTNIEDGKLLLEKTDRYISEREAFGWYSHFMLNDGDIIIACSGVTIEKFHEKVTIVSKIHLPLCMNTSTMRFKITSSILLKDFFFHFLKSKSFKEQIGGKATGSAQLNFGPSHVKMVEISLPALEEQTRIATILSDMDTEISALEIKLSKYKQIKQGMMQELLTGKTRLI